MKNVFYFSYINKCGGVESFLYYMAKKYRDFDITIYYMAGDVSQVKRIAKYVRIKQYDGKPVKCKYCFIAYNADGFIENVEAEKIYFIIHADYKAQGITFHKSDKITNYISVSDIVGKTFKEYTGIKETPKTVYNPVYPKKPQRILKLISATRLTPEKGKERMVQLINLLDKAAIPWEWKIFTDNTEEIKHKNVFYRAPRLDIINYIAEADYLVQLSSTEAFCYSVAEALTVSTPVLITDLPIYKELKLNKSCGYVLPLNMQNVDVNKIYNEIPKPRYTLPSDVWAHILAKGKSTYREKQQEITVIALVDYWDLWLQFQVQKGQRVKMPVWRAEDLEKIKIIKRV